MWRELGDVAQIGTGYPFRGKVEHVPHGSIVVLQQKDVTDLVATSLQQRDEFAPPSGASRVEDEGTYGKHLLQPDDVLLQVRGTQFLPVIFTGEYPAIAAQGVAVFRTAPALLPSFLHWFLGHPKTTETLRSLAGGTHIPFLSKQSLIAMQVPVPPLHAQHAIVATDDVRRRYRAAAQQLIQLNDQLVDAATWHAATEP